MEVTRSQSEVIEGLLFRHAMVATDVTKLIL